MYLAKVLLWSWYKCVEATAVCMSVNAQYNKRISVAETHVAAVVL